jgi:hypothetical protein
MEGGRKGSREGEGRAITISAGLEEFKHGRGDRGK